MTGLAPTPGFGSVELVRVRGWDDVLALVATQAGRLQGMGLWAAAGQTVFHYHQHLIPRSAGETLKLHTRVRGDDGALREVSVMLANKLAASR